LAPLGGALFVALPFLSDVILDSALGHSETLRKRSGGLVATAADGQIRHGQPSTGQQ
jgi:hypothetical protein